MAHDGVKVNPVAEPKELIVPIPSQDHSPYSQVSVLLLKHRMEDSRGELLIVV